MSDDKVMWISITAMVIAISLMLPKCGASLMASEQRKMEICIQNHQRWVRGECM